MTVSLRRRLPAATIALLALAATITSIGHDFTFDDRYVVKLNGRVHVLKDVWRLFAQSYWPKELGGDGYRPVTMSLFTVQWAIGHGAPWVFHLGNILLAIAAALAVFWCARSVLSDRAAWVAAALFAVHPVHVEVTGNVVGQSELVVAICLTLAVGLYVRQRLAGPLATRDMLAILALFAVGLLAKEHAIVLPALLVAAELTVIRRGSLRARFDEERVLALSIVAVAVAYLYVRGLIQRDNLAGFVPYPIFRYLNMSAWDRIGTMMTEIPRVAQLLVFPTHLSGDYSPADVYVSKGFELVQLPGLFICAGVLLLAVALRRRSPVASFGLLWLVASYLPVSNLLIPAGFITAERTLFFPSVGVVLVAGALAEWLVAHGERRERRLAAVLCAALLALGVGRSIDRQRVWKSNDVFFPQLVKDAPLSYRAHFLLARHRGQQNRLRETDLEYRRAIRLFPYDASMTLSIASAYARTGLCKPANSLFEWGFGVDSLTGEGRYDYAACLANEKRWSDARREALRGMAFVGPKDRRRLHGVIAAADTALGRRAR